jgi:hypothetical protein
VIVQNNDMTTDNGVDDLDEMFHNEGTDSPIWHFTGPVRFCTHRSHRGNRQNFKKEPSLRDIVRDRLRLNAEFGKKFLANDEVVESIDSKMNNFTMVVQNELSFKKLLETQITQLASALPHPNGGGFLCQPATPVKENVKVVITRFVKTVAEPKASPKKTAPIEPNEEEEEVLRLRSRQNQG